MFIRSALKPIAAALIALALTVGAVRLGGGNVALAFGALWDGALGVHFQPATYVLLGSVTFHAFKVVFSLSAVTTTLVRTCPLLLTGLGIAVAFRAKLWNIGGQGQFVVGALLASYLATECPGTRSLASPMLLSVMMLAGTVAGALWAGAASVLKTARAVPEVISTIMLNFVAIALLSYLVNGPMQRADHAQPATEQLSLAATLPVLIPQTSLHAGLLVAVVAALIVWLMLNRTIGGFAIRAVGASPDAAALNGYKVAAVTALAMAWSGGLCGLAGAVELSGVLGNIPEGYAPEYGFNAIAVALVGRLEVGGTVAAALLFGALAAGSENMERIAGVPHEVSFVIQASLLLALLAMGARRGERET